MISARVHRFLVTTALTALLAACSAPPPSVTKTPAPRASASTPAPRAPISAAPPAATGEEPTCLPPQLPPRVGAPGSTRGTIACGDKRCDASREICAILDGPVWGCIPRYGREPDSASYDCDDGTDCPQGQTCCRDFASASEHYVCTTRDRSCSVEVCVEGGASCPAGQSCQSEVCAPVKAPLPTCGRGVTCSVEQPICAWNHGNGECVSEKREIELERDLTPASELALLRCTKNADCGSGFHCCTGGAYGAKLSSCSLNCDLMSTAQYCATDADCPKLPGFTLKCKGAIPGLPVWSKLCSTD